MPDPSPVLKVLHTGETDITSTDISKFTFHSGYPTLKVATSGSTTLTISAGDAFGEVTVNHNLGYVPVYLSNITYSTKAYQVAASVVPYPYISVAASGGPSIISFYATTDDNTLTLGAITTDTDTVVSDTSFTANWIIFLDEF